MASKRLKHQTRPTPVALAPLPRFASVDVMRGLTILVMIFVNDVVSVAAAPWWMRHFGNEARDADGMTFVDLVFPMFLFVAGMAIPFAIGRRLDRGDAPLEVWAHILTRTFAMIVIGVFMANMPADAELMGWPNRLWDALAYLSFILVWTEIPGERGGRRIAGLCARVLGITVLIGLIDAYGGGYAGHRFGLSWLGIVGLIGFAYLTGCAVYIALRRWLWAMALAACALVGLFMVGHAGWLGGLTIGPYQPIGSVIGSHGALVVFGILLGQLLLPGSPITTPCGRITFALGFGVLLAVAAVALREPWGINKNVATPAWVLWSAAISAWCWALLHWVCDVRSWTAWARPVRPAGENPLLAYILSPFLHQILTLIALEGVYHMLDTAGFWPGFLRSVAWAFFIAWLAGFLSRVGVRLKL